MCGVVDGVPQDVVASKTTLVHPTLQDVWDMNSSGVAVGSVSVVEQFTLERIEFDSMGLMNWFKATERGLDVDYGTDLAMETRYWALFSTAGEFDSPDTWRWLGPLAWGDSVAIAQLVNDAGMIAGYGGVSTGDSTLDAFMPTHAFRAPASGEFDGTGIKLADLGVLAGGLHSMPRAMNQAGDLVGFSDFDAQTTGGLM